MMVEELLDAEKKYQGGPHTGWLTDPKKHDFDEIPTRTRGVNLVLQRNTR